MKSSTSSSRKHRHYHHRLLLLALAYATNSVEAFSLSRDATSRATAFPPTYLSVFPATRRDILANVCASSFLGTTCLFLPQEASAAGAFSPNPQSITTVILDSAEDKIGVELTDLVIKIDPNNNSASSIQAYPVVKSVRNDGESRIWLPRG